MIFFNSALKKEQRIKIKYDNQADKTNYIKNA